MPPRLPVRATFSCSVCGKEAGAVRLHADDGHPEVCRESWPGVLYQRVSADAVGPFEAALGDGDVRALFALEPQLAPFYCPECDSSYCSEHWDWWDVWDDEWIAWRDSVRGRCPHGHERMLED